MGKVIRCLKGIGLKNILFFLWKKKKNDFWIFFDIYFSLK